MMRYLAMAGGLWVAFAPLARAQVDEARLQQLVAIICDNGGAMETSDAAQILPAQGFTMSETQGIVAVLEDRGQVVPTAGMATLKLAPEACQ
ncbi:MAG: hypothetical protein AAFY75_11750 [Pseudomonadota bacterium]